MRAIDHTRPLIIKIAGHYARRCALYRMIVLHVTTKPQVVYRAVYVDWKLQINREKRSFSETRAS